VSEPLLFAGILGALLLFRLGYYFIRRRRTAGGTSGKPHAEPVSR
jgi:hypothetical protein